MHTTAELAEGLQLALTRTGRGVVGFVDDLLRLCPAEGLQLEWQAGRYSVRAVENGSEALLNWPVSKSVVRAILVRVAALCNKRCRISVSPYGGEGELVVDADAPMILRLKMTNTTDERKLELVPVSAHSCEFKTV
jgi:hypothetical protein